MKQILILSAFIIVAFSYTACKKSTPVGTTTDSIKVDTVYPYKATNKNRYPYTDTFVGQYSEDGGNSSVTHYSGTSTVFVRHVSANGIVISAASIGIPRLGSGTYPAIIYEPFTTSALNTYNFDVQVFKDGWDRYTCMLSSDSLQCRIYQESGSTDPYAGTYSGYKK